MMVQNKRKYGLLKWIGDSFRGETWVALNNRGDVRCGGVINGGFGWFLDGSGNFNNYFERIS